LSPAWIWVPIWVTSFLSFAACRISRTSSTEWASGFSQYRCLPRPIAISDAWAWVWSGVLTTTASTLLATASNILR
jgi:hypothetical protein